MTVTYEQKIGCAQQPAKERDFAFEAILDVHETTVQSIQQLDLVAKGYVSERNDGKWDREVLRIRYRWSMTPTAARSRYWLEPDDGGLPGAPLSVGDRLEKADELRTILYWDSSNPTELNPINQGNATFLVEPAGAARPFPSVVSDPPGFLLLAFRPRFVERRMTLREFCAWGQRSELLASRPDDGESRVIRIWHPVGQELDGTYTDVFLGLKRGLLVNRVVQHSIVTPESGSREEEWNVVRWRVLNDGFSFPLEVERVFRMKDKGPVARHHWIVDEQQLVLNQDVAEEAMRFAFPKNALVRYLPPKDGKVRVELWGDNNEPVGEIRTQEDLREFITQPRRVWGNPWIWGFCSLAAIGSLWFLWRRRIRNE